MEKFLTPIWIAIYLLMTNVSSDKNTNSDNIVYAYEHQEAELAFKLPEVFRTLITVQHERDNSRPENVLFVREQLSIPVFADHWVPQAHNLVVRPGLAKFTIKSTQMKHAGLYFCLSNLYERVKGCDAFLYVVGKPDTPTISQLDHTFKCFHKSRTKPGNHGLSVLVKWKNEKGHELRYSPTKKFSVSNDTIRINDAKMFEAGFSLSCSTAEVADKTKALVFSEPSEPFVVKPAETTTMVTTMTMTSVNLTSTKAEVTSPTAVSEADEIKEEPSTIAWTSIALVVFVIAALGFCSSYFLWKRKTDRESVEDDYAFQPPPKSKESHIK